MRLPSLPIIMFATVVSACTTAQSGDVVTSVVAAAPPAPSDQQPAPSFAQPDAQSPARIARAAVAEPLTIESAVRRAVAWHPVIGETVERLRQQQEAVNEARAGYLPSFGWGVETGYRSHYSGRPDRYRPQLVLTGSQLIYDFGKVDGRVRIASAGVAGRESQVLMAVDDLARQTAQAVIELQRNRALSLVAADQVRDTAGILDLVRARNQRGASTRSDLLQAEARVQAAESTVLEVGSQIRRWESAVASFVGSEKVAAVAPNAPQWLASACHVSEPNWARVPAMMEAEAASAAARGQLALSQSEALPSLWLEGRVGDDIHRIGAKDPDYRVGLNVTGTLYNGGLTSARRNAATHALRASETAVLRVRVDLRRNLTEARSQIAGLQRLLASLASRQRMMKETRDLYRRQYLDLGTRTLLDLLNADQELHAARFDAINTEHEIRRLSIDCTFNAGNIRDSFRLPHRMGA